MAKRTNPAKKKVDVKKVQVKDLEIKARQLKLRGGTKSLGRAIRGIGGASYTE